MRAAVELAKSGMVVVATVPGESATELLLSLRGLGMTQDTSAHLLGILAHGAKLRDGWSNFVDAKDYYDNRVMFSELSLYDTAEAARSDFSARSAWNVRMVEDRELPSTTFDGRRLPTPAELVEIHAGDAVDEAAKTQSSPHV